VTGGDGLAEVPFRELPDGRAGVVFGADDVLGCLNRQTPQRIRAAAELVREGRVFSLNAPIDWPTPPLYTRRPVRHTVFTTPLGNLDDHLDDFFPQASSQWDALSHVGDPTLGRYNGHPAEALGIEHAARRGIVGRGVLVDVARVGAADGRPLEWDRRDVIDVDRLRAAIDAVGATFVGGDILLLRTGWVAGYQSLDDAGRAALGGTRPATPGLAATDEMAGFLWELGLSAIAADNPALEASPTDLAGERLHPKLLARLGLPIGELWWLDELAEACAADGRVECLVTSAPLHVPGGIGSPANALALR
jgi:kynurenine formamidase